MEDDKTGEPDHRIRADNGGSSYFDNVTLDLPYFWPKKLENPTLHIEARKRLFIESLCHKNQPNLREAFCCFPHENGSERFNVTLSNYGKSFSR